MNRKLIAMLGMTVLFGAMTLTAPTNAQPTAAQVVSPRYDAQDVDAGERVVEPHPQIRLALRSLELAKRRLEVGAHDFGGHRVRALVLTNRAIAQAYQALRYDRR